WLTEAVVETVVKYLPRALANPRDATARSQLSWCGALALSGMLSGREGGWPVHALEHGLSAWNDIAHGRGLSLLLPRLMAYDARAIPEKIAHFNKRVFGADSLESGLIPYMKDVGAWWTISRDTSLFERVVDHALEIKGIWKRGEEPYLDNCRILKRA